MYLGAYQIGATVPLRLRCRTTADVPVFPDDPPVAHVFDGSNAARSVARMPVEERYTRTGQFHTPLFLGSGYTPGHYTVVYYYAVSGAILSCEDTFEVLLNGSANGAVTAAYFYERPEASYVIQGLEDGSLVKRRNPSV